MKYVTLYPEISNIELVKDVGQIPYNLHQFYNFDTEIVANNIDEKGSNIEYVKGVKLTKLSCNNLKKYSLFWAEVKYLFNNAKQIDWLNLYHCGRKSLILAKLFKLLNPQGKVHLKLDLDFRGCNLYDQNLKERKIFQKNMLLMDLVTAESESVRDRIQTYTSKKIHVLSDGFIPLSRKQIIQKNIFLTAGRIGVEQKATDILLRAFANSAKEHNWKLELIGNIDVKFIPFLKKFLKNNPNLEDRIIFKKSINDREQLYSEYAGAKVFVLDSRWESFGLVLPEALAQGCSIIASDKVPIAKEITNNKKFGKIVKADDVVALSHAMTAMTKETYTEDKIKNKIDFAIKNYSWKRICGKLNNYLRG